VNGVVRSEPRVFRDTGAILAETPFWLPGVLHWADIDRGELHVSPVDGRPDGADDRVLRFDSEVAAIQPAGDGYVIALAERVVLADADGREVRELARIPLPKPGVRLNEGKVDPQGRLLVGAMDKQDADAAWYRVGPDGATVHLGGFGVTNGLDWSLDGRTVYLADTSVGTIYRAAWHPDEGPGEPVAFHTGAPSDGGTLDSEGCLWTALNGPGRVLRLGPDGEELEAIDLPVPQLTGICFGGEDLTTLFVCSAREDMGPDDLAAAPLSGAVFAIDTAVAGLPVRRFALP